MGCSVRADSFGCSSMRKTRASITMRSGAAHEGVVGVGEELDVGTGHDRLELEVVEQGAMDVHVMHGLASAEHTEQRLKQHFVIDCDSVFNDPSNVAHRTERQVLCIALRQP